jgi:mannose/cellobiose epimerase-like protein (N-acyl-D-glucosamine 2-epimerase family)
MTGRLRGAPKINCRAMNSSHSPVSIIFRREAEKLRDWLFEVAFPLWWRVGADHAEGGFHERIDFGGHPLILPRRARVAARQAFAYYEAGRLGWNGPWREAGRHALNFLRRRFVQNDATVIAAVGPNGAIVDPRFDLYNQAFALLAYSCGHQALDPSGDWQSSAYTLVATLKREFAHPDAGFREDRDGALALRANPHMHLLEAALVWLAIDRNPMWRDLADQIVALCLDRFIDPRTGALREMFTADWVPLGGTEGGLVEPGHHYEWAFLLDRWAKLTGRRRPAAVSNLIAYADNNGVDSHRRVAINAVSLDGSIRDPAARLWPQTERLRAYIIERDADGDVRLREAIASLWCYLNAPLRGLWYENLAADGQFVIEAAPATSLYHIVGAAMEMWAVFGDDAKSGARTPG